jgi:predicted Co/Zn/Cd cation transporter (cation efflux family)
MSLRMFHMVFIGVSVVLAAFVAAWAVQQYQSVHAAGYAATAVLALVAGGGLIKYGTAFQRKTRTL